MFLRNWLLSGLTVAALFFCAAAKCDLLDDLSHKLDLVEKRYWNAVNMDHDKGYYTQTCDLLHDLERSGRQLQTLVSRTKQKNLRECNLTPSIARINSLFFNRLSRNVTGHYKFNFETTSLDDYENEHKKIVSRKGEQASFPTLATVDMDNYEKWLTDICSKNLDKYSWSSSKKKRGQDKPLEEVVGQYFSALLELRMTIVQLRQSYKGKFEIKKERQR